MNSRLIIGYNTQTRWYSNEVPNNNSQFDGAPLVTNASYADKERAFDSDMALLSPRIKL